MSPSSRVTLMSDVSLKETAKNIPCIMCMEGVELGIIGSTHSSSGVDNLGTIGVDLVVLDVLWPGAKELECSHPHTGALAHVRVWCSFNTKWPHAKDYFRDIFKYKASVKTGLSSAAFILSASLPDATLSEFLCICNSTFLLHGTKEWDRGLEVIWKNGFYIHGSRGVWPLHLPSFRALVRRKMLLRGYRAQSYLPHLQGTFRLDLQHQH